MPKIRIKNQPMDSSKEFLKNWYQKRNIQDSYIQEAFNLDRPSILKNLQNAPQYKMVPSIGKEDGSGKVTGRYDPKLNKILITPDAPAHVKTHELTHFANIKSGAGDYMRTIHKDIVKNEVLPKSELQGVYKNKYEYFSNPDEVHSRIMVLREKAGFKPDEFVTPERLKAFFNTYKGDNDNINDLLNISKGEEGILNMLNYMAKNKTKNSNLS
jgi:hypothetical protein